MYACLILCERVYVHACTCWALCMCECVVCVGRGE